MAERAVIDMIEFVGLTGDYILKEIAVIDVKTKCVQHWMFKSRDGIGRMHIDFCERHTNWLTERFNGICLHMDKSEYTTFITAFEHVTNRFHVLYAPTVDMARKIECMLEHRRTVVPLELLGCPPPMPDGDHHIELGDKTKKNACLLHFLEKRSPVCALKNVYAMAKWCEENARLIDMSDAECRQRTFREWSLTEPSPTVLAKHGFVHRASSEDTTVCVYCNVVLYKWLEGYDAKHHENSCIMVQRHTTLTENHDDGLTKIRL